VTILPSQKLVALAAVIACAVLHVSCSSSGLKNIQQGNPQSGQVWEKRGERLVVPFEWYDGHLIVPVRINGSERLRFAFDSGAAATVLFETERTRSLRLEVERQITLGEAPGKPGTPVNIVNDVHISLDGISLTRMTVLHVPLARSPIFASMEEAYFDGAIGYDLLRRFVTEIDYINRTVSFTRGAANRTLGPHWQTLPIDVSGRVPLLAARMSSGASSAESVQLIVDTGAPSYVYLNPDLTQRIDIPRRHYLTRGNGFNGPFERMTGRVETFGIGTIGFNDLVTHFDRTDFKDLGRGAGLIGNRVLRNFDLLFDYSAGTLSMRPNTRFDSGSAADRSGIDLEPHRVGAIVQSVAEDSTASGIGLERGDVVTRLDGQRVGQSNFDELKELLSLNREAVEICWRSGSTEAEEVCKRLPLRDRL
jgi:predicted aspartyl protease